MAAVKDLTGLEFLRLKVLERAGSRKGAALWKCVCICGGLVLATTNHLMMGNVRSCGCLYRDTRKGCLRIIHGISNTPEYVSWKAMQRRCADPSYHAFKHYGGRGIEVCEFLRQDPRNLISLVGFRPVGKTIDRIDGGLNYSCGSCPQCKANGWNMNLRWATAVEQIKNRRSNVC